MIKCIIFDFAGVIADEKTEEVGFDAAAKYYGTSVQQIKHAASKYNQHFDTLEWNEHAFWTSVARDLNSNKPPQNIWAQTHAQGTPLRQEVLELIKSLKTNGYTLAILSNTVQANIDINTARGAYDQFDVKIFSCDPAVHVKKPDEKIYQICLEKVGFAPQECIFIDDRKSNLFPAQKLGMHTLLYTTFPVLTTDLRNLGVTW